MDSPIGHLSSVETLGAADGPGIRFVAFLQGCPLRCVYCHNPETWDKNGGENITATQLMAQILRYAPYFSKDGGVTISGGEPLLQGEFLCELLTLCKEAGIHTAIDTSGACSTKAARDALALCDLVLLDLKFVRNEDYLRYTGAGIKQSLETLRFCRELHKPVWIRQVIVPGLNDNEKDIDELAALIKREDPALPEDSAFIKKAELLPFRKLCLFKYDALGIPFPLRDTPECSAELVQSLQERLDEKLR